MELRHDIRIECCFKTQRGGNTTNTKEYSVYERVGSFLFAKCALKLLVRKWSRVESYAIFFQVEHDGFCWVAHYNNDFFLNKDGVYLSKHVPYVLYVSQDGGGFITFNICGERLHPIYRHEVYIDSPSVIYPCFATKDKKQTLLQHQVPYLWCNP